jgi:hypothetical protein
VSDDERKKKNRLVIEVPEELRELGEAFRELLVGVSAANRVAQADGRAVDYGALERMVSEKGRKMERGAHRSMLQALDVDKPQVVIEGKSHTRVGRFASTYYTDSGEVEVTRSLYREVGVRNGKTVDAVSLRAGVVGDGWLPATARVMAFLVAQTTSRDAARTAKEMGRVEYSRSAFEDVMHMMGRQYVPQSRDIEEQLISAYEVPKEARSVSASLDRVSLPMEEPRERPVGRPKKGAAKRPVARTYRMAWCGTVTLHDSEGKALHTIRYGLMPQGDPVDLVTSLVGDVAKLVEKRPELRIAALADGAHDLWKLLEQWLNEETLGVKVHYLVDLWHLLEKLGKAARVLHGEAGAEAALNRWRLALLNRSDAARDIILELWASGRRNVRVDGARPVREALTYLVYHRQRMNYASARRHGLPVGSGNVEATCKSLVELRMKRPGARWKEETGAHVLQLRALSLSDRWHEAMALTLEPLRKAVRAVR